MCTSGCGIITAIFFSRWNSASLSATSCAFQYTSPSLFTEISMFSGLVWRAMLLSLGRFSATVCVTTGMVIRKMISSTSITSTSGVVLMLETTSSSPPLSLPTFIAMLGSPCLRGPERRAVPKRARSPRGIGCGTPQPRGRHLAGGARAHQHAVQVAAEAAYGFHRHLVAPNEPVVAKHRRHRHGQTERGHDQRLTDLASDFIDARLAGDADRGQGVVDAPDGAEESDERRGRSHGGQEGEAVLQSGL